MFKVIFKSLINVGVRPVIGISNLSGSTNCFSLESKLMLLKSLFMDSDWQAILCGERKYTHNLTTEGVFKREPQATALQQTHGGYRRSALPIED